MSLIAVPTISVPSVYKSSDFTYYVRLYSKNRGRNENLNDFFIATNIIKKHRFDDGKYLEAMSRWDAWEGQLRLVADNAYVEGRAVVVKCYEGAYVSITLRLADKSGNKLKKFKPSPPKNLRIPTFILPKFDRKKHFAVKAKKLGDELKKLVLDRNKLNSLKGLVIISGSTNSLKSEICRALVSASLLQSTPKERRRHLVTLEDPIEKKLMNSPEKGDALRVDYTPRELGRHLVTDANARPKCRDCRNIKEGLRNALRMTPSVVYIGETRDKRDWSEILKFASTGHLIFTTSHSGSLAETIKNVFEAVRAKTPADRGKVAESLLAVIHLKTVRIKSSGWKGQASKHKLALLPQVWLGNEMSVASLVSDGLSSIQPCRGDLTTQQGSSAGRVTCFSRASFVEPLLSHWKLTKPQMKEVLLTVLEDEISGS